VQKKDSVGATTKKLGGYFTVILGLSNLLPVVIFYFFEQLYKYEERAYKTECITLVQVELYYKHVY
jgi:hypothetical protein